MKTHVADGFQFSNKFETRILEFFSDFRFCLNHLLTWNRTNYTEIDK